MPRLTVKKEALDKFKLTQSILKVIRNEDKDNSEILIEALEEYAKSKGIYHITNREKSQTI